MSILSFIMICLVICGSISSRQHDQQSLFRLEGSQTSYAGFPKWLACPNSSIEFDFETRQSTALLLYLDDRASSSFLELKLVRGSARLRYKHKANEMFQSLGDDLNDGKWHKVHIRSRHTNFGFFVDGISHTGGDSILSDKTLLSTIRFSSVTYVGGLPAYFRKGPWHLSLPSSAYEAHFHGSIRNFTMKQCGNGLERMELVSMSGIRNNLGDPCALHDPCQNGGWCISTDAGPVCECDNTDYMGVYCNKEKPQSIVSLFGNGFIGYDLKDAWASVLYNSDYYSFWFRTNQTDALLLYTGNADHDYVCIEIRERALLMRVRLGSGVFETDFRPKQTDIQFDDNHWHRVVLTRDSRELVAHRGICHVTIEVDNKVKKTGTVVGDFGLLSSRAMFLGGISSDVNLSGSRPSSFLQGCFKQAVYRADGLSLDLILESQLNGSLVEANGGILYDKCEDMDTLQPVMFTTEESVLELPEWNILQDSSSIEFTFQTNEADGLLLHSFLGKNDGSSFLGLHMLKGYLYFIISVSKAKILRLSTSNENDKPLHDGTPHRVLFRTEGATTVIKVDGGSDVYCDIQLGRSSVPHQSDSNGRVYLGGGISSSVTVATAGLWSEAPHRQMVRRGFVGCARDLLLNGNRVSLTALARRQEAEGVVPLCRTPSVPQCTSYPCLHGGVCTEGWNRFICDCRATGFWGPVCAQEATVVHFDGTQYYWTSLGDLFLYLGFSISVRFRTSHSTCLLLALTSTISSDFIHLVLEYGRLRLDMKSGADFKSLLGERLVDDGAWHTAFVDYQATDVELGTDNDDRTQVQGLEVIHLDTLEVGLRSNRSASHSVSKRGRRTGFDSSKDRLFTDVEWDNRPPDRVSFVGLMQQLVFNGKEFFEVTKINETADTEMTAVADRTGQSVLFATLQAYLIATVKIMPTFVLYFQIKTTHPDGLIMYSGILGRDFFAVELSVGHLFYIYDVGFGARLLRVGLKSPINDNSWHDIAILQVNTSEIILRVDNVTKSNSLSSGFHFDTNIELYVGGVSQELYNLFPRQVRSRHGFQGCLSAIDFGTGVFDLIEAGVSSIPTEHKDSIKSGCRAKNECRPEACHNKGVCIENWDSVSCDCDLTSFTGPTCSEDSIAYSFGKNGGTISFTFDESEHKDLKHDFVAFGLSTQQTDAILLRLLSWTSKDFMEFELIDGSVFVTYNLGLGDHRVGELQQKVNDHHYHIIRFTRLGANASLQIDDHPTINYHPQGHQLNMFNSRAKLYVGGSRNPSTGEVYRPFKGTMAGLVINSLHLLDLVAEGDHHVTVEGDIQLDVKPPKFHHSYYFTTSVEIPIQNNYTEARTFFKQDPQASSVKGTTSDEIFSGESSGCHYEDLDSNCIHSATKSDVFFFFSPKTQLSTIKPEDSNISKQTMLTSLMSDTSGENPCDSEDEDCETSGDSGVKTTTTLVSSNLRHSQQPPSAIYISNIFTKSTTFQQLLGSSVLQTTAKAQEYESIKHKSEFASSASWSHRYPAFFSPHYSSPAQMPGTMSPSVDVTMEETSFVGIGSPDFGSLPMNIALLVSISLAVSVLLCMLAYILYKCHIANAHRDEAKVYTENPTNKTVTSNGKPQTVNLPTKVKKKDVKEWYV